MMDSSFEGRSPVSLIPRLAAPITCLTIVGLGIGLSIPLLTFEMEAAGITSSWIGANTAIPSLAAILLAPLAPKLAGLIGTSNLILAALLVAAVSLAMFLLPWPFWMWFPLRFVFGAAIYYIFVISEFWINASIDDSRRGFVLGIYATILAMGFASGPLILTMARPGTAMPYLVGIAIFILGMIPILIWRKLAPEIKVQKNTNIFRFFWTSPTSALAAFTFGALETGTFALLSIYALRHGFSVADAAFALAMTALGSVFFQIPLGLVADRIDRRLVLIFCAIAGLTGTLLLPYAMNTALLFPMLVMWGGIIVGLYTVGLAHLGARFSGEDLLSANSLFIFLYALGSLISPVLIGQGMDIWDPEGYIGVTTMFISLFLVVAIMRWMRNPRILRPAKTRDTA